MNIEYLVVSFVNGQGAIATGLTTALHYCIALAIGSLGTVVAALSLLARNSTNQQGTNKQTTNKQQTTYLPTHTHTIRLPVPVPPSRTRTVARLVPGSVFSPPSTIPGNQSAPDSSVPGQRRTRFRPLALLVLLAACARNEDPHRTASHAPRCGLGVSALGLPPVPRRPSPRISVPDQDRPGHPSTSIATGRATRRATRRATTMATPQRNLSGAFEAANGDASNPNAANGDAANPNAANGDPSTPARPGNPPRKATTPLGRFLPRGMRMVELTDETPKRGDYLGWDDYFLGIAVLSSLRSKDPSGAEGACIADASNRIVAIGYSGFPRGCPDTVFPWGDQQEGSGSGASGYLASKHPYLCTAATNAVLNKGSQDLSGCRLYATAFPRSDDVKVMIQSGIRELVVLQTTDEPPIHGPGALGESEGEDRGNDNGSGSDNGEAEAFRQLTEQEQEDYASNAMLLLSGIAVRYHRPRAPSLRLCFGAPGKGPLPPPKHPPTGKRAERLPTDTEREAARVLREETGYDALLPDPGSDAERLLAHSGRREDYLSWEDYFMSVALLTAQRSKDPSTQVGACIVDGQNRIVGLGYNGMPTGLDDDLMPWGRANAQAIFNKYVYVTHAEVNAILNSKEGYGSPRVRGGTLYVTLFPCEHCTKKVVQSGIRAVVYLEDKYHDTDGCKASRAMLRCAGIEVREHVRTVEAVTVDFGRGGEEDQEEEDGGEGDAC
ncbi:unnamed protein product [Pseudo-nitzschia multistriata]|uniref:dCMP deaminase n=1 Tax=Pseudo-nitzschia multistriata TaxID=183589 RepID=A0A448ZC40_9STRA|nr:unnamed protein product [Pseudo-nitzschia multistriata]